MRLAVLADIHGNIRALEAVLADVADSAPDLVVNLGDCASSPLQPAETLARLMAERFPTVRGNHDRIVGGNPRATLGFSDGFAHDRLDAPARAWLAALPSTLVVADALLVHGTPADDLEYLCETPQALPDTPAAVAGRLAGVPQRLVLCGHSHLPRVLRDAQGRIVVNPGSVGAPGYDDKDHSVSSGAPHARWALLTRAGNAWRVDLRAVEYDWDAAARDAAVAGRADWARVLATGFV